MDKQQYIFFRIKNIILIEELVHTGGLTIRKILNNIWVITSTIHSGQLWHKP